MASLIEGVPSPSETQKPLDTKRAIGPEDQKIDKLYSRVQKDALRGQTQSQGVSNSSLEKIFEHTHSGVDFLPSDRKVGQKCIGSVLELCVPAELSREGMHTFEKELESLSIDGVKAMYDYVEKMAVQKGSEANHTVLLSTIEEVRKSKNQEAFDSAATLTKLRKKILLSPTISDDQMVQFKAGLKKLTQLERQEIFKEISAYDSMTERSSFCKKNKARHPDINLGTVLRNTKTMQGWFEPYATDQAYVEKKMMDQALRTFFSKS